MPDSLNQTFAALADPTRRAILDRLREGEASVGELAASFPVSQPAISKHLKVLETAGLISRRQEGTRRYARIDPARLVQADEWIERFRGIWANNFTRLDRLLVDLQQENEDASARRDHPDRHASEDDEGL